MPLPSVQDGESLFLQGVSLASRHRPEAAADCFAQALAARPRFVEAARNLGLILHWLGREAEAADALSKALAWSPDDDVSRAALGEALAACGRYSAAARCWRAVIARDPGRADGYAKLAITEKALDRTRTGVCHLARALAIEPGSADRHYALATALLESGRPAEAVPCFLRAIRLDPLGDAAHLNLAVALRSLDRLTAAAVSARRALSLRPDSAGAWNTLGAVLWNCQQGGDAEVCCRRAIRLDPGLAEAHANLGVLDMEAGRFSDAAAAFETAVGLAPERGRTYRMLADCRPLALDDPIVRRMETMLDGAGRLADEDRMELHFALGAVYLNHDRPTPAFAHLAAGNRMKRASIVYDEAGTFEEFRRIRQVFSAEFLAAGTGMGVPSRAPVFIVGMPRSGTTLAEQILASHPVAAGAGEPLDLPERIAGMRSAVGEADFPGAMARQPPPAWRRLGADYLRGIRRHGPGALRIIDKLPENFQWIGVIRLALPGARIIHLRRDPVDTCLSCYSKLFSDHQPFTYDLAELARYYRAYEDMMAHWRAVLPDGVMLEVRYEDLVADIEGQARRMLVHCGLDWDARCLAFHRTERPVRTASAAQVRQPLYASSVGRWRVFAETIAPLLERSGD